ncbi:hypothetical protein PR048_025577 [Dryococelus australis]|uniref:Uncharacterized protein n=1 Tax=Dryococelus australis TaxID=614101 RepID=A0ABQ9GRP2_9NEOP|nr:hypothetical protein PR048_025577 [Dryococelus australis]
MPIQVDFIGRSVELCAHSKHDHCQGNFGKFQKAFQDDGLTRKIGLLHILITTKLDECNTVEEYVNWIVNTALKLLTVGLQVSDEWTGAILLAGLPRKYEPMIMSIESSGIRVTGDSIKAKLLQDITSVKSELP